MSRKDYIRFARLLKDIRPNEKSPCHKEWERLVNELAILFKEDNNRFKREKFFKEVGYDNN